MSFIVAIDGPAGTGKGTITEALTKKWKFDNIDTGATYRCVAAAMLKEKIGLDQLDKIKELLERIEIKFEKQGEKELVFLNGEDVTEKIRSKEVSNFVSPVSSIKEVRFKMVELQRKLAEGKNIIMEGRDIGTYVFPNADIKIYMDADVEVRAKRRFKQNQEKGIEMTYEEVLQNIVARDENDKKKEIGALKQAEDAIYLDTTNLSVEENIKAVEDIILARMPEEVKKNLPQNREVKNKEQKKEEETKKELRKEAKLKKQEQRAYAIRPETKWKQFERKWIKKLLAGVYHFLFKLEVKGEPIPEEGAYIICANHINYWDAVGLVVNTKRKVYFMAKEDLFHHRFLNWIAHVFDVIPIKRGTQDLEGMKRALKVLNNGELLGLFPEGTRKGIAKSGKLKNGAAFMALRTGVPVIPCGIQGNFKPFTKVILNFGKPLDFGKVKTPEKEQLENASKQIMESIIMLTNEKI
ncbi:MAG: (d)CMP kinase [Clostridia bacterium]